jgi:hypothetical protein
MPPLVVPIQIQLSGLLQLAALPHHHGHRHHHRRRCHRCRRRCLGSSYLAGPKAEPDADAGPGLHVKCFVLAGDSPAIGKCLQAC